MPWLVRLLSAAIACLLLAGACESSAQRDAAEQSTPSGAVAEGATAPPILAEPAPVAPAGPQGSDPAPTAPPVEPTAVPAATPGPDRWFEPLEVDGRVTDKVLANGLRFLVVENDAPGNQAQLRLVIKAGSIDEFDEGTGAAHFLEHMMFNGTKSYPGNDIVTVLEEFGSSFGAHVNASTSFDETIYKLQVPAEPNDLATVELGLGVLREWSDGALLDPDDVVNERGVVREELRVSRERATGRLREQINRVLFAETPYFDNSIIGSASSIEQMTAADLRAFYERWYRPENIAVIVVGDIDRGAVETMIERIFDDLGEGSDHVALTDFGPVVPSEESVFDVFVDPEINYSELRIDWRYQLEPAITPASLRQRLVRRLSISIINERIDEAIQRSQGVFVTGGASRRNLSNALSSLRLSGRADATEIADGLRAWLVEMERIAQHGVAGQELDRARADIASRVEQSLAESTSRQDRSIADDLVSYVVVKDVPTSPQRAHDLNLDLLESIGPADIQRDIALLLETAPVVIVTGPTDLVGALPKPEDLQAVYRSVRGVPVDDRIGPALELTMLMDPPDPVEALSTARLDGIRTTVVSYPNGARMAFRQTQVTDNRIAFRAVSPGGLFVTEGPLVPLLARSSPAVTNSGFESIDAVDLGRLLTGEQVSLSVQLDRTTESLSGEAASADIETLMQLIHLQMTEPTINSNQARLFDERWRPLAEDPNSSPGFAATAKLFALRYGDDPYFRLAPTLDDLDRFDALALSEQWHQRFSDAGDFVFVFVGDIDEDELLTLGEQYLATLPDADRREIAPDRDPGLPDEHRVATVASGVGDRGQLVMNWESPYPVSVRSEVQAAMLEIVVNARLRDVIREQLGASYSPSASVIVLTTPEPWIDSSVTIEGDPQRLGEVSDVVRAELERLRNGDIDQGYLDRAAEQLALQYGFFSNREWLDLILVHVGDPSRPDTEFHDRTGIAESMNVAALAIVAAIAFPSERSIEVRLVPADSTDS